MATLHLTAATTVADLRKEFNEAFGSQVKVYIGNKGADMSNKLSEAGLSKSGDFECRSSLTVATFIERMKEDFGLKVKVYTCDEWVAVLDGLTLESSGKVKKNAVKADMESMIAYQRTEGEDTPTPQVDNTAKVEAEKAAAEKAKAELDKQKAEAEAAKTELARIQAEAAKAKAQAEAAKAAATPAPAPAASAPAQTSNNKGALNGLFSISGEKKIRFSMGNLQYNAVKYEFRFANKQWEILGDENSKIAPNFNGWIDLFGWGNSGYMGKQPCESSTTNSQYGNGDNNISGTNFDWGHYNPISNGGNKDGLWRTLTIDEWKYLIGRPNLKAQGSVNGVNGLILLPDNFWELRIRIPLDSTPNGYVSNVYNTEQWAILESAGAVFLPAAGKREGNQISSIGEIGYYWSSIYYDRDWIKALDFSGSRISLDYYHEWNSSRYYNNRRYGYSVRLVQDIN